MYTGHLLSVFPSLSNQTPRNFEHTLALFAFVWKQISSI